MEKYNCLLLLLPLWDLEELLLVGPVVSAHLTDDIIRVNFAVAGGVPRTVFHLHVHEVQLGMDHAIGNQARLDALSDLCGTDILDPKFEPVHKLLHLCVHPDFLRFDVAFASSYVCEKVLSKLGDTRDQQCKLWLRDHTEVAYTAMRCQVFEAYVLRLLARPSGPFRIKCLEAKCPDVGPFGTALQADGAYSTIHRVAPHPIYRFKHLSEAKRDHINIPIAKDRGEIDAFFTSGTLLRITVSLDPGVKQKCVSRILHEIQLDTAFVVFAVPSGNFDSFQQQPYLSEECHVHYQQPDAIGGCIQFALSVSLGD